MATINNKPQEENIEEVIQLDYFINISSLIN